MIYLFNTLHYAVRKYNIEVIKFLIAKGADLKAKNNDGYDAYQIANEYNPNPVIIELLKEYAEKIK